MVYLLYTCTTVISKWAKNARFLLNSRFVNHTFRFFFLNRRNEQKCYKLKCTYIYMKSTACQLWASEEKKYNVFKI